MRGFVVGGWPTLENDEGDLTQLERWANVGAYHIGEQDFERSVLASLTADDVVIFLPAGNGAHGSDALSATRQRVQDETKAYVCTVQFCSASDANGINLSNAASDLNGNHNLASASNVVGDCFSVVVPHSGFLDDSVDDVCLLEFSCKLFLNAVSTFAWVANGKVFGNRMIDLAISNNKLYFRAQSIVRDILTHGTALAPPSAEVVESAVLRAIHGDEAAAADIDALRSAPVSLHVQVAGQTKAAGIKIVPCAVLLASGHCATRKQAHQSLQSDVVLRDLVQNIIGTKN